MLKDALATLGLGLGLFGPPSQTPGLPTEELASGTGVMVATGQLVTLHFLIADETGVELANSKKRGLPYTFRFNDGSNDLFCRLLPGMRVGGQRRVHVPFELAYGATGLPPIVPPNQPIVVVLTVLKAGDR